MKKVLILLLLFLLFPQMAQALTLPVWVQTSIDEQGESRIYLSLGVSHLLRFSGGYAEDYQFLREELNIKPFSIWHSQSWREKAEEHCGLTIAGRLWERLNLSLMYRNDQTLRFYSSYRLGHRWSVGLSGYGQKKSYKGRLWLSYGLDLADFLPEIWFEEKPRMIEWKEF